MMKTLLVSSAALGLMALSAAAQTAAPKLKFDMGKVNMEQQPTPQIQANNIVDKRWKPKNWLEFDTEFEIKLPTSEGRDASFPSIEIRYYIVMSARNKEGKSIMLTGSVSYANIPAREKVHALAFVSPSTLKSALQKDNGGKGDVAGYAIQVKVGDEVVGGHQQGPPGKWWEDTTKFAVTDGAVVGKDKTPFAPFWGDYDLTPQSLK